jgi:hypothetical protein
VVADALSRKERLKMITTSEELTKELEKLEIEVKRPGGGQDMLMEIRMQPPLLEKIRICQEQKMEEEKNSDEDVLTGEEIKCERDARGIMRYNG